MPGAPATGIDRTPALPDASLPMPFHQLELHVQQLAAVNDIETLTTSLSAKTWQKITLLGRAG